MLCDDVVMIVGDDVDRFFQCDLWNGGGWSIHSCEPSRASPGPHLHQFFQLVLPMAGLVFAASCCCSFHWDFLSFKSTSSTSHTRRTFRKSSQGFDFSSAWCEQDDMMTSSCDMFMWHDYNRRQVWRCLAPLAMLDFFFEQYWYMYWELVDRVSVCLRGNGEP
jgi:hypothetical protein